MESNKQSNLERHAEYEMRLAGLYDKDSDYAGMIPEAVMKLIRPFAEEGHSGSSAGLVLQIFGRLAKFKTLSPVTSDSKEWGLVVERDSEGKSIYQNIRDSACFSNDGGKTYYSVDDPKREIKPTARGNG